MQYVQESYKEKEDGFRNRLERVRFFLDRIKYSRERHFCLALVAILFFVSAFAAGSYFYQKNKITEKENILRDYFAEISTTDKTVSEVEPWYEKEDIPMITSGGFTDDDGGARIVVYICGHVRNPGVYEIDARARVSDLLDLCGGARDSACLEAVNLAKKITDGERVYIPSEEEAGESGMHPSTWDWSAGSGDMGYLININQASVEELKQLPGIGDQIAKNILDHRQKYGPFQSKEELKNVNGIGEKKYERVKGLISI
jgi:competence protein ComEA